MGKIDLHIHSLYSDGDHDVDEVYKLIKDNGIKIFSITDHDEIRGAKKMAEIVDNPGILYIPGIELTAKVSHGRMHILGYDYDINNRKLNNFVISKKDTDFENLLMIVYYLRDYGIYIKDSELEEIHNKLGNIGRMDVARLLVKLGYATDIDYAFDNYLRPINDIKEYRTKKIGISKEECIELIHQAGGLVSWAHPISYAPNYQELYEEVKYLKSIGLDALEVEHIHLSNEYRTWLLKLCQEFNLLHTGGTDYHGEVAKPNVLIGTGINNNINYNESSLVNHIKLKKKIV